MVHFKRLDELTAPQWHKILTLRAEAFVVEQQCAYQDPDEADTTALHVFVNDEERVVSYARLYKNKAWHIGRVVTCADLRGRGLASDLLRAVLDHLVHLENTPEVELSAQVYLSSFYSRFGFHTVGGMYLEDGIPHVRMVYQRT